MIFIIGATCTANELKKEHQMLFGKISHNLPSVIFKKPRTIATLINPGITEEYRFEEAGNAALVLVVTKIRQDYPKDDSLLDKVKPKHQSMQKYFGDDIVLLRNVSKEKPRIDEMIFLNAEYDQKYFPYGMGGKNLKGKVKSLGISHFFVKDGLFIECSMYLEKNKKESKEEFIKRAKTLCGKWQKTIKVKKQ
jgi:hypothetical protein